MWPDTLPASMVVPAGFTLYVPGDLDLSGTDLTVHGTVTLPPAPPGAASEAEAGLVELATQAEVDAGTDALRAVTPATLAAWSGAGDGLWNDAIVTEIAADVYDVTVEVQLSLDGEPPIERCAFMCGLVDTDYSTLPFSMTWTAGAGTAVIHGAGGGVLAVTNATGVVEINISGSLGSNVDVLLVLISPTGRVIANAVVLRGFSP